MEYLGIASADPSKPRRTNISLSDLEYSIETGAATLYWYSQSHLPSIPTTYSDTLVTSVVNNSALNLVVGTNNSRGTGEAEIPILVTRSQLEVSSEIWDMTEQTHMGGDS